MTSIWTVRRSTTDTKLSGLCGGLAQHWGVDPLLVRVACALLALSGGIGLILYLAGWLLIPVEGKDKSTADVMFGDAVSRWPRELWVTLVIIACIGAFAAFGALTPFSIGPAVVIAIIWYFGFYKPRQAKRAASPTAVAPYPIAPPVSTPFSYPGTPTPFTQAAEAWARRIQENTRESAAAATWPTLPPAGLPSTVTEPAPSEARPTTFDPGAVDRQNFLAQPDPVGLYAEPVRGAEAPVVAADRASARRLRLVGLIAVGLVLSGLGALDYAGAVVPLAAYLATALLVLGLTLVVATWLGRGRGLLPLGMLLGVAVLAVTASGATNAQLPTFATQTRSYATTAALPVNGDRIDVGNLTVDLSRLALTGDATYSAHVDLGQVTVVVPSDARVVVHYAADGGAVTTFGDEVQGGSEVKGEVADPVDAVAGQPTLTLDVSVDVGHVEVRR